MDVTTAFLTLLFVMDPLGNIPIFLAALKDVPHERRQKVILRELLFALLVLLGFLFGGQYILIWLGLSEESISITGAILLFLIAIKMVFPDENNMLADLEDGEPFFVPLAVPVIAGPSTMAVLMLMTSNHQGEILHWLMALLSAWLVSSIILLSSAPIARLLGKRGLMAVERLMGMVLVMLAVQLFIDGLRRSLS